VRLAERERLEERREELSAWLENQRERKQATEALPARVRSFLDDFQGVDVRRAKAMLQTILKAAYVYNDGRIELEFRN
jgi:hypothetical protein